jgi:electron transfer flavoprotein beta subunit
VKIAVCMKRVPEMDVKFRIAASGTAVDETGLKFDMSDFDGYAAEFAIQLTEKLGAGEVTVVSLGPDAVQETLRKALSMGAARAVHLKADAVPVDNWAVASALAAELTGGGYDLVLFGKMAADTASGATGLMVAELMNLPMVQAVSRIEVADGRINARREVEGGAELVTLALPAAASLDEGIARPRYPSLKGIMAAKKKPLDVKPAQLPAARLTVAKLELPPERGAGRIVGEGAAAVPELVRLLQTEAKVL